MTSPDKTGMIELAERTMVEVRNELYLNFANKAAHLIAKLDASIAALSRHPVIEEDRTNG